MKKTLIVLLLFLTSCASVNYNPATGEFHYYRVGDQSVEELRIEEHGIVLKGQKADGAALSDAVEAIRNLSEAVK